MAAGAALVLALVLVPLVGNQYAVSLMIIAGLHVIAASGLTLLLGFAGQISLAQAAFYAMGAYGSMIGSVHLGLSPWIALVAAAAGSALVAWLIGVPTLRLHGHYLALATLGFGIIVYIVLGEGGDITGGPTGAVGIPRLRLGRLVLDRDRHYYVLVWVVAMGLLLLCRALVTGSSYGRVLRALQASEVATESVGIDVTRYKVQVFVLSALLASLAGSLYAHYLTVISPSEFGFDVSIELLVMAVIGGLGSVWGALVGVLAVTLFIEVLRTVAPLVAPGVPTSEYEVIAFGGLLVLTLLFFPSGITGGWSARRAAATGDDPAADVAVPAPSPARSAPPAGPPVLTVEGVSKRFGGVQAVSDVSFGIAPGQICGLIGPNGAGKTTLFNLVSGVYPLDAGAIGIGGVRTDGLPAHRVARLGVARTFQNLQIFGTLTVRENVMVGLAQASPPGLVTSLLAWTRRRREEREQRAAADGLLARVGLPGAADRMARDLSFGEQRLLEIARALATRPRLLLLDEPASGLSRAEVHRLVALLRDLRSEELAIFLIEHDVSTVMDVADVIVVLNHGRKIAEGTPEVVRTDPAVIEAYLGLSLDEVPAISVEPVPVSPALLQARDLVTFRGDVQVLRGASIDVVEGEAAAIIGPNGAGKSTLLGTLAGLHLARAGEVRFAGRAIAGEPAERIVRLGLSLVPERRQVFEGLSVEQNLRLGAYPHHRRRERARIARDVAMVYELFPRLRELAGARAGGLSGGEQQMLAIGRGLMAHPTLLMLDEPSLGLAPRLVAEIFRVLEQLKRQGTSILVVEQNARTVFQIAHRVAVLERGAVVLRGTPVELSRDSRVVAAYVGGAASAPPPPQPH